MKIRVRYYTEDERGELRKDRNDNVDIPTPELIVPLSGSYIWNWYFDLSTSIRRVRDGVCEPIPPSEFTHWRDNTGHIVYPSEYAILRAMDRAYCAEMNVELSSYSTRERERMKSESNTPTRNRRR